MVWNGSADLRCAGIVATSHGVVVVKLRGVWAGEEGDRRRGGRKKENGVLGWRTRLEAECGKGSYEVHDLPLFHVARWPGGTRGHI